VENKLDKVTESQLEVLRELKEISESLNITLWLRGGWAIDFLLGQITRLHRDIDLITWIEHKETLENALREAGYNLQPISIGQTDFCKSDVDVQIGYLTKTSDRTIHFNGIPEWIWRNDCLSPEVYHLEDIAFCTLNPYQLIQEKHDYKKIGRIPREKDKISLELLQQIVNSLKK
jgi:hypothetical protein